MTNYSHSIKTCTHLGMIFKSNFCIYFCHACGKLVHICVYNYKVLFMSCDMNTSEHSCIWKITFMHFYKIMESLYIVWLVWMWKERSVLYLNQCCLLLMLQVMLMFLIILTGNYNFFNWLYMVVCLPLVTDGFLRRWMGYTPPGRWQGVYRWVRGVHKCEGGFNLDVCALCNDLILTVRGWDKISWKASCAFVVEILLKICYEDTGM